MTLTVQYQVGVDHTREIFIPMNEDEGFAVTKIDIFVVVFLTTLINLKRLLPKITWNKSFLCVNLR